MYKITILPSYIKRILFSFFLILLFFLTLASGLCNDYLILHPFLMALLCGTAVSGIVLIARRQLTWDKFILLIMLAGIFIRIFYMLAVPAWRISHDFGDYTTTGYGHACYILSIFHNRELPQTNASQFYHAPLFHILSVLLMKITAFLFPWADDSILVQTAKVIACIASCQTLFLSIDICKELKLKERASAITMIIASLLPIHFIFSKLVNNDSLVTMFMTLIILYTIRWYKQRTMKNICILALSFGLGMLTKASCGTYAIPTGLVMLYCFYQSVREKNWKTMIGQFAVFGCIAFPLGLAYPIRNFLLFGQSLGYVPIPWDGEYAITASFLDRYVRFPFHMLLDPLWCSPTTDYNLNYYILKTSVLGEFTHKYVNTTPAMLLVLTNLILMSLSVAACVCVVWKLRKQPDAALSFYLPFLWLFSYVMQMSLLQQLPFGCSMDFRYIVPTSLIGAIYLGIHFDDWLGSVRIWKKSAAYLFGIVLAVFSIASIWMYANLYQYFDFPGRRYL